MKPSVGMWIWNVRHCEEGELAKIIARATQTGLGHVLIKTNDGRDAYNGTLGPLVGAFQSVAINVWSWQYTYGRYPEAEANAFAARSQALRVQGLCVDAEVEYKKQPGRADRYMTALVDKVKPTGKPIAVSSYYLPENHPDFPWREFYRRAEYAMPQVYWYSNDPPRALRRSLAQHTPYAKPVIVAGTAVPAHHGYCPPGAPGAPPVLEPGPRQVTRFLDECARTPAIGMVNFWSWEHCTEELWTTLREWIHRAEA